MRMFRPFAAVALLWALASLGAAAPVAAQQGLPGVAVVDLQRVMRDSSASKSIREQIDKLRAAFQKDVAKQENELRNADQELARQRSIISAEAFAERRRAFEQRVANLQREVQNRRRELDRSANAAGQTVEKSLQEIVGQIVTERKYTLVLVKNQTIYTAPEMEITQEVIKRLNARLPSVKVPPPGK